MQKYFNTGQAGSSELCALEKKILCLNLKFVLDAAFSISVTSEEGSRCLLEKRKVFPGRGFCLHDVLLYSQRRKFLTKARH